MRDQGQTISGGEKRTVDEGARERCRRSHSATQRVQSAVRDQQRCTRISDSRATRARPEGAIRLAADEIGSIALQILPVPNCRGQSQPTLHDVRKDRRGSSPGPDAATCRGQEPRRSSSRPRASSSCKVSEAEAAHAHGRVVDPPDAEVCVAVSVRSAVRSQLSGSQTEV